MNITLSGTKVSMDGHTLAFQKNNLVDSMVITVDTDETWQYKLDVKYPCKDSDGKELYNVIDLTRVGNTCTAILQAPMLPFNGKYTMQLRGISGNKVYHTDTFDVWVKYSIDPGKVYDPVPSEFYQIEQAVTEQAANAKQSATESAESATNAAESATKAENAVVHSPIIGENGNWFIWDFEKSEYVDSGKSASTPPITPDTAGKYLTNDGSKAEWGVPSGGSDFSLGITGATVGQIVKITEVDTDGKPTKWQAVNDRLPEVTPSDDGKALYVEQIGEFEYGYGFTDIPNISTFIPLGITDASPGQFARIKHVDDIGQPTVWEAVEMSGGSDISLGLTAATVGQTVVVKAVDADGKPTQWEAVDAVGGGGGETWELIAEIDFDVDAANDVSVWEYKNLPNYKELSYRKVGLVGSTETASGLSISINDSVPNFSGIQYSKKNGQSNGWGKILLLPFGWIHVNSGSANSPTNYAYAGLQTMYNAIPFDGDSITSVRLSSHSTYKIAGGKLSLYGRR